MEHRSYYWMTKATPQRQWIEGRGILLWLAFFFIELGAGLYLVSIPFESSWGIFIGWVICLLFGGGFHLIYLGRPLRFGRAFLKPATSWIARGLISVAIFAVIGAIHLALGYWSPNLNLLPLQIIMGVVCFFTVIYGGFAMSYVSAIPLWNSGLVPVLFTVAGFWGGLDLLFSILLATGARPETVEGWIRITLIIYVIILGIYLLNVRYSSTTGSQSVSRIVRGDISPVFYLGGVIVGILYPLLVVVYSITLGIGATPTWFYISAIICGLVGDLTIRYCILKGGMYRPLVPAAPSS